MNWRRIIEKIVVPVAIVEGQKAVRKIIKWAKPKAEDGYRRAKKRWDNRKGDEGKDT